MKLLTVATAFLFCSASVASNSMETRDEGGPIPICLYMTNDYNWNGEGINFCQVGGQCGEQCTFHFTGDRFPSTDVPQDPIWATI